MSASRVGAPLTAAPPAAAGRQLAAAPASAPEPAAAPDGPGAAFARAVAARPSPGAGASVHLAISLPLTFPLFAHRPRYTVRHLLPAAAADGDSVPYLRETAGEPAGRAGTSYADSPEASLQPAIVQARLTDVSVRAPVPDGLLDMPGLLAGFVDRRVVVRLCTVENQVLLRGSADGLIPGLLALPRLRRRRRMGGGLAGDLAQAAAWVEDAGGSCDGMVVHPDVYWALAADGALERFSGAGLRVARTRMIDRALALLGDFRAAATLLDPARSALTLVRSGGRDMIEARNRVGLAVHLPGHLLLLELR